LPSTPELDTPAAGGDLNNDGLRCGDVGDKGCKPSVRYDGVATEDALSPISERTGIDGALVDLDFTGKLDLLLIPPETNSVRVLRNLGNMYFKDVTSTSGVPASLTTARRLVTEDWNNDDIMDVWVVRDGQPPLVLVKERGGPLTDTNSPVGWPAGTAIAAGDLNNDLRNDAVIAAPGRLECVFAGITNRLRLATAGSPSAAWTW